MRQAGTQAEISQPARPHHYWPAVAPGLTPWRAAVVRDAGRDHRGGALGMPDVAPLKLIGELAAVQLSPALSST